MKEWDVRSLIESERQKFVRYARSLIRNRAEMDAEDIVHDVIVKVLERADLTTPENFSAYVFRSVRNRVIDVVRTRRVSVSLDAPLPGERERLVDLLQSQQPDVLSSLQTDEGKRALFTALDSLSDIEKDVVVNHEFEGTSFKEMSVMWQIPVNTLLSHKSRAMSKLKKHFSQTFLADVRSKS